MYGQAHSWDFHSMSYHKLGGSTSTNAEGACGGIQ